MSRKITGKRQHYIVTLRLKWKEIGDNTIYHINDWYTTSFATKSKSLDTRIIQQKANEAALDYARERSYANYEPEITEMEVLSIKSVVDIKSLRNMPFYRYKLSYPNLRLYNTEQDLPNFKSCGFEMLLEEYPKRSKSIENLEKFFLKKRTGGLTPNDLLKFCEHHNLNCYVMDLNSNAVVKHVMSNEELVNRTRNRESQPLMVTVASEHFYLIRDPEVRRKIKDSVNKHSISITGQNVSEKQNKTVLFQKDIKEVRSAVDERKRELVKQLPSSLQPDTDYYFETNTLSELYLTYLGNGLAYKAKWNQKHVKTIYMPKNRIIANEHYTAVERACDEFEVEFKNQSPQSLARQLWNSFSDGKWKESHMAPDLKEVYDKQRDLLKASAFTMTFEDYKVEEHPKEKVCGIDIKRCYPSEALKGEFIVFDITDTIQKYEAEDISPGMYYAETRNYWPLKGNGFYMWETIQFALERNLITKDDIKHVIRGKVNKAMGVLMKNFIEFVYKTASDDSIKKLLINALIGSFGVQKTERQLSDVITSSTPEAHYYYYQFVDSGKRAVIESLDLPNDETVNIITAYEQIRHFSTNYFIRKQIVERGNVSAYKLYEYVSNFTRKDGKHIYRPLMLKTDAVYYAMRNKEAKIPVPKNPQMGEYREEKKKITEFKKGLPDVRMKTLKYKTFEWNIVQSDESQDFDYKLILDYERVFVLGKAGNGKTHIINNLRKELGDEFLYLSFTHTAANNIDGKTLHHAFGVNIITEACNPGKFAGLTKKYKGIIIDEINQCPRSIFRILTELPEEFKVYTFGDHRQELPVNERYQLVDTEMFKQLMKGNKVVLNKQYRADKEYSKACAEYHDLLEQKKIDLAQVKISEFISSGEIDDPIHDINIVRTNLCRCFINEKRMLENKPENCMLVYPIDNPDSQVIYLYPGLPIICNFTLGNKFSSYTSLYNGEHYVIDTIEEDQVWLRSRELNINSKPKSLWIPIDAISRYFSPGYAFTTYKAEGATIDQPYTIWEFDQMHYKTRYTALTRTTNCKKVFINNAKLVLLNMEIGLSNKKARIYMIYDLEYPSMEYIGSTTRSIKQRFEEHKEECIKQSTKFYDYIQDRGVDKFAIKQLLEFNYLNESHIYRIESYFIQFYDTVRRGLNMRLSKQ